MLLDVFENEFGSCLFKAVRNVLGTFSMSQSPNFSALKVKKFKVIIEIIR